MDHAADHSSRPATLAETATAIAGHIAVEEALFELTGRWSVDPEVPAVASFLAAQSAFHGWRAAQWTTRLPRSVEPGPTGLPTAWRAALDAVEVEAAPGSPLGHLAIWTVALQPGLLARYRRHRSVLAPAADGGVDRWLGLVLADGAEGWQVGNGLLHGLAGDGGAGPEAGGAAAVEAGARVLASLLAAGG